MRIYRQNAIEGVKELFACADIGNDECDITYMLENLPSADRPPGEWIEVTNGRGGHECSECHSYAPSYASGDEHLSDYCPNCGVKMVQHKGV